MSSKFTDKNTPKFLLELLEARSPSGHEFEAQDVLDKHIKPLADMYERDALGNRFATLNPKSQLTLMLSGHMDELGFIVQYIDDKGFIYFDTIGGHDVSILSGRKVHILNDQGVVTGITGKRAIHLLNEDERKKLPKVHDIWIDIGARSKEEALKRVSIGDAVVYKHSFEPIYGSMITARALDNKAGCYVINEVLLRLAKEKNKLNIKLVSVSTTQEEIGIRGATTAAYKVNPDLAIAVDVSHATDHPDCNNKKFGETFLGKGPILTRGPNVNPKVLQRLISCAKKSKIPYQLEADPRPTGTDARALQISREGVATALVSIPLRYMHTPCEMIDLNDLENTVKLLVAFAKSLTQKDSFTY